MPAKKGGKAQGRGLGKGVLEREAIPIPAPSSRDWLEGFDYVILGGGAAGMMAALLICEPELAGQPPRRIPARVLIVDPQPLLGRKILAAGNGRCNLGNEVVGFEHYHTDDSRRVEAILKYWPSERTRSLFHRLGLPLKSEEGRLYPASFRSASVLYAIQSRMLRHQIYHLVDEVTQVQPIQDPYQQRIAGPTLERFRLHFKKAQGLTCRYLILATGGLAQLPKMAPVNGYDLAETLGFKCTPCQPALTRFLLKEPIEALTSARVHARVNLWEGQQPPTGKLRPQTTCRLIESQRGEVMITESGLSGIPVLTASYAYVPQKTWVTLDFFPDFTPNELQTYCFNFTQGAGAKLPIYRWCNALTHEGVGLALFRYLQRKAEKKDDGSESLHLKLNHSGLLSDLFSYYGKSFPLSIAGVEDFHYAQVTHGGIQLAPLLPGTLSPRDHKRICAIGELLNVDGICGGYNLHWAWASAAYAVSLYENWTDRHALV